MKQPHGAGDGPVTVLTVRDPGVLAVAQSLLDDAGIPYFAKSENSANVTPFLIWTELQVEPDDAEEALALLAGLAQP
jgi:putative signal transducing protein